MSWTTRIAHTAWHAVMFAPVNDRRGPCPTVAVQIPEARRPEIRRGLKAARCRQARLIFLCNTADQADRIAITAAAALPAHRRIALERALAGGWGSEVLS